MDAAVYLHLHHHLGAAGAFPLPLPPPPIRHSFTSSTKPPAHAPAARLTVSARPRSPAHPAASSPAVAAAPNTAAHRSSSRAATGYAAALADACARAGTLRRAARHARAVLSRRRPLPSPEEEEKAAAGQMDARVAALLRMLVGKGRAEMVPEVLAEFAAICDHLLPPPRAHHAYKLA